MLALIIAIAFSYVASFVFGGYMSHTEKDLKLFLPFSLTMLAPLLVATIAIYLIQRYNIFG